MTRPFHIACVLAALGVLLLSVAACSSRDDDLDSRSGPNPNKTIYTGEDAAPALPPQLIDPAKPVNPEWPDGSFLPADAGSAADAGADGDADPRPVDAASVDAGNG